MKLSKVEALAALMALVVAATTLTFPAFADTNGYAQTGLAVAFISQPSVGITNATASYLTVLFQNQSPGMVNGTIYGVVRNTAGETVQVTAATFAGLGAGQNATAELALFVPFDAYAAIVFAVDPSGLAISGETNSTIVA